MDYQDWIVVCLIGILLCVAVTAYSQSSRTVASYKSKDPATET